MTPEVLISIGQLVFSIVLAAVTVWYAIETSRMRRTADRQSKAMEMSLSLTKASFDATLLPYLVLGINQADESVWNEYAKKSKLGYINLPGYSRSGLPYRLDREWVFNVVNVTDRIASHIFLVWFDQDDRRIFISTFVVESVGPKEELIIPMSAGSVSSEDLEKIIREMYEGRGNYLLDKNREYININKLKKKSR